MEINDEVKHATARHDRKYNNLNGDSYETVTQHGNTSDARMRSVQIALA